MPPPRAPDADGLPMPRRLWAVLGILLGTFLGTLDSSIANVALPTIAADLGGTPAASVWVVNGYQLATAVALLPLSAVGERLGAKRLYLIGTAVFTLSSLACAVAPGLGDLVAARFVQGLGGACSSVVGAVLMRAVFPARLLGRGISLFGLTVAISYALGPSVAAAILSVASWRWLFAVNVPIAAVALLVAAQALPRGPVQSPAVRLDRRPVERNRDHGARARRGLAGRDAVARRGLCPARPRLARCPSRASAHSAAPARPARPPAHPDLLALLRHLRLLLHGAGDRLRLAALLLPAPARLRRGAHRPADHALAGGDRHRGADLRLLVRPLPRRRAQQHRPVLPGGRSAGARPAARRARRTSTWSGA